ARTRAHEPGDRGTALHLGTHGRVAQGAHHAEAALVDPRGARALRAVARAARRRALDAEPDSELSVRTGPVKAFVCEPRCSVDQLLPRREERRDPGIVDQLVDDPFDLGRLADEDDLP